MHGTELRDLASLATPIAIRVAATLRLADHLAAGQDTPVALAGAVDADADSVGRLLRHLATVGLVYQNPSGGYQLTDAGQGLRETHPEHLRSRLDMEGAEGRADLSFVRFLTTIRTGRSAFEEHYGQSFWAAIEQNAQLSESFHHRMGLAIEELGPAITQAYDWSVFTHVVDVGGGNGALLKALLSVSPNTRGTIVDLPQAADHAQEFIASNGLAGRAEFVAGSFFEPLLAGADAYVLSAIIHNWPDAQASLILRRCAQAVKPSGRVFVVERIASDGRSPDTASDLHMAAYFGAGARERSLPEIGGLAASAGLRMVAVHPAGACAVTELAVAHQSG